MAADRPSADIGRALKEARERRGTTLRQIANATKISVRALEALERGDISRLPGGIFSRAFVRAYATEVGLDPEETVERFLSQFPHDSVTAGHPVSGPREDFAEVESSRYAATTIVRLVAFSVPVAALLLYFVTSGRPTEPPSAAAAPVASAATTAVAPSSGESSAPPSAVAGQPDAARPVQAAVSEPVAETAETPDTLRVMLSTTRPCWVSARADGATLFQRILAVGEQETIAVHDELVLTAGDAAALTITLNGTEARPLGKAGQVVTTRLNLANFRDYLPNP